MAGRNDPLVPEEDVSYQYKLLQTFHPNLSSYSEFEGAGHLAFTIGQKNEIISEIMSQLKDVIYESPEKQERINNICFGYSKISGDLKYYSKEELNDKGNMSDQLSDVLYNSYYLYL